MTIESLLLVGVGGSVGALSRYLVQAAIEAEVFPTGTLVVNVVGSFVLGVVAFAGLPPGVALTVGTGACGAFTTFSSFAFETVRLVETGHPVLAGANAAGNFVGALAAVGLAWLVVYA